MTTLQVDSALARPPLGSKALLTDRQRQILAFVALGCTNAQVGHRLGISEGTLRKHLENVSARLGVTSRTAAITAVGTAAVDWTR